MALLLLLGAINAVLLGLWTSFWGTLGRNEFLGTRSLSELLDQLRQALGENEFWYWLNQLEDMLVIHILGELYWCWGGRWHTCGPPCLHG